MIRPIVLAAALAACTSPALPERPDATPLSCDTPTTLATYRVDSIQLGSDPAQITADAFDVVNDDGVVDNQLGAVFNFAVQQLSPDYAPDALAAASFAGAVDWEVDTETCPSTGETRVRIGSRGGSTPRAGGELAGATGTTLDATHGCAEVPVTAITGGSAAGWVLADQMDLAFTVGDGEVSGTVGFALDAASASDAFAAAMAPFLTSELARPINSTGELSGVFDTNGDGIVTPAELEATSLYTSLLAPDGVGDRPPGDPQCPPSVDTWLSFGAQIHAVAEAP